MERAGVVAPETNARFNDAMWRRARQTAAATRSIAEGWGWATTGERSVCGNEAGMGGGRGSGNVAAGGIQWTVVPATFSYARI